MFRFFSGEKLNYEKGQVFPFLIAVLVVVIVMVMITVNLGQIGVFKTDVSNAADAGALAGASSLSGALLEFGLTSDNMAGFGIITTAVVILELCFPLSVIWGIITWIASIVKQFATYFNALGKGRMAWSNAKKAALQYAFQNAGVDEPRPTFEEFLGRVYGLPPTTADIAKYYKIYLDGDDPSADDATRRKIKICSQSGFGRFMEDTKKGVWDEGKLGKIDPGVTTPVIVTSGYGWSQSIQNGKVSNANSYDQGGDYSSYENYVEVKVTGTIMYPLGIYNMGDMLIGTIRDDIKSYVDKYLPWWIRWIVDYIILIVDIVIFMLGLFPAGLEFASAILLDGTKEENTKAYTTDNPIRVDVAHYKRNNNLGLWNFRYGKDGKVSAAASACAYPESDLSTISPACEILDIEKLLGDPVSLFDTKRHLFEAKLKSTI